MNAGKKAVKLHSKGYNCAQSVLGTCSDLDTDFIERIASGFGGGVRSGEICGAISGAVMALGLENNDAGTFKKFVSDFRDHFGCVRCIELKAKGIPCDELIEYAADAANKVMENKNGNL